MANPKITATVALVLLGGILSITGYLFHYERGNGSPERHSDVPTPTTSSDESSPPTSQPPEVNHKDLAQAVLDSCKSKDFFTDRDVTNREDLDDQMVEFEAKMDSVSRAFANSDSTDLIHLAAILTDNPEERVALIQRAIQSNPGQAFVYWTAVRICSSAPEDLECPLAQWEQRLTELDGQNSETWMRIAANRHTSGDRQGALIAVKNAAAAAESRVYFAETIDLADRGFAASGNFAQWENAGYAFALAASSLPNYGQYLQPCKTESATSAEWAHTCLQYGKTIEIQSKTIIGRAIALNIQKQALEALGDLEGAASLQQRIEAGRKERRLSLNERSKIAELVLVTNRRVFNAYVSDIATFGESGARSRLTTEVGRLIAENPESICQSAHLVMRTLQPAQ